MATSYLSPGVYIEEVERGSKPIEAVGTSTAAFIGESSVGPTNEAVLITNWAQYTRTFGDFSHSTLLAHAVYGFFNNGGTKAFICNVSPRTVTAEQAAKEAEKKEAESKKAAEGKPASPAPSATPAASAAASPALYIGKDEGPGRRTGLNVFNDIPEISLVCAPGQTDSAIQDAVISHCENNKYRFAILDSAEELGKDGIAKMPKPRDSQYAAYYFPWIQVYDPDKGNIFVPPSGHMAGIYARSDSERGVHKAPANEIVRGALGLKYNVSKGEQDLLNPKGINAIRFMNGGIRIWGARTLSSDPSWRYINVRRLFIMVESSIERATQWVVFEPNDHRLWKRVQRTISSFLTLLWRNGALMGTSPEQAFYVKCDEETNPPEVIDAGQLVVEIGLAPVKPAEFVIFRIGQMASGGGVEE